eukprot:123142_1
MANMLLSNTPIPSNTKISSQTVICVSCVHSLPLMCGVSSVSFDFVSFAIVQGEDDGSGVDGVIAVVRLQWYFAFELIKIISFWMIFLFVIAVVGECIIGCAFFAVSKSTAFTQKGNATLLRMFGSAL